MVGSDQSHARPFSERHPARSSGGMLQDTSPACVPQLRPAAPAREPACSSGWIQDNRARTVCRMMAARRPASTASLPETRRVGRENLIGKNNPFRRSAKLKFCVRQNQPARFRMLRGLAIDCERQPAQLGGIRRAHQVSVAAKEMFSSCAPSWLLVAGVNSGSGRCEPSCKPAGKRDAADRSAA